MLQGLWFIVFLVVNSGLGTTYAADNLPPDLALLREIGQEMYDRSEDIMTQVVEEIGVLEEDVVDAWFDLKDGNRDLDEYIDCGLCLAFVRGIQGFINQGLEFEDVRDFAVEICKNATEALKGYDGEIMCDGLIDNYGPHVYYVLNVTTMDAREVCEFHNNCPNYLVAEKREIARRLYRPNIRIPVKHQPNLQRKSKQDMIKLAHITDVHLDEFYAPGAPDECDLPVCCRDDLPGTGSAGPWGSYGCALPLHTLDVVLTYINGLDVDVVINTGDTPSHAIWLESQEGQIWQNELLADAIRRNIPGVPCHVAIGNHDMFPTNLFYRPSAFTEELLHELRLMYQDLANFTEDQMATFEDGAYYISEMRPGLKIMSYNTDYGTTKNFYGVLLQESQDWINMVSFMEEQFDLARDNGDKIILLGHHFMGRGFKFWDDFINDILLRNGDIIVLHFLGHSHNDFYKMALTEDGDAVHVNFVTGSVKTARNPTFKVIYVDPDTFIPMEFDTYFINISKTLDGVTPAEVEFMYNSYVDYQMEDLTPASYQNFTDRMEEDEELFDMFRWNEDSRIRDPSACDESCKEKFFCDRRTTSSESYDRCRDGSRQ